jgi:hypothetical protein
MCCKKEKSSFRHCESALADEAIQFSTFNKQCVSRFLRTGLLRLPLAGLAMTAFAVFCNYHHLLRCLSDLIDADYSLKIVPSETVKNIHYTHGYSLI